MKHHRRFFHVVVISPWIETSKPGLYETLRLPMIVQKYKLKDWEDHSHRLATQFVRSGKNFGIVTAGVTKEVLERLLEDEEVHVLWRQPMRVREAWKDRRNFSPGLSRQGWLSLVNFLQKQNPDSHRISKLKKQEQARASRQNLLAVLKPFLNS